MARARQAAPSDAVSLLKRDHADVKQLFKQFQDAEADEKASLVELICAMLKVHTQIEEEIFYPAAREVLGEESELIDEAEIEHGSAKELISKLEDMQPGDDRFDATVTVLGEYINHHVGEEEGEIFPKVKKARLDGEQLGAELKARKDELMADLGIVEESAAAEESEEEDEEEAPAGRRKSPGSGDHRRPASRGRGHASRAGQRRARSR
jgi:hemerythrin superfamily protein